MSLLDIPKWRVRAIMVENINSANCQNGSRRVRRKFDQHLTIRQIVKEFGTPVGPRRRYKKG